MKIDLQATAIRRFWDAVELPADADGCWLWKGKMTRDGYGELYAAWRYVRAHRFSFQLHGGVIPAGLQLDHTCRVRRCVNPAHLEPVSLQENLSRGRAARAAT